MSRERGEWIPWYCEDSPGWVELSFAARGVAEGIARKMGPKRNALHLGSRGLRGLCRLLHGRWDEFEPAMRELLSPGPDGEPPRLIFDEETGLLSDPQHEERRRPSSAERVRRFRSKSDSQPGDVTPVTVTSVTSVSETPCNRGNVSSPLLSSDLISSSADQKNLAGGSSGVGTGAASAPPWFDDVLDVIEMNCGEKLPKGEAWLRYAGHRSSKREPPERDHAIYWLTTVMVKERQDARDEAHRRRERDAKHDARFKNHAPKVEPQTPAQAKKFQNDLLAELTKQAAKKGAA